MLDSNKSFFEKNSKKIIFVIVTLVFILLLLLTEFILSSTVEIRPNANKRFINLREVPPYTNTFALSDDPNYDKVIVKTDSDGIIKYRGSHNNPDIKVFFIGSSTLMTINHPDSNRLSDRTGMTLEKLLGKKVNTYNSAYSATTSFDGLNVLVNKAIPYKPDYIVFMFNAVDLIKLNIDMNYYWKTNLIQQRIEVIDIFRNIKNKYFPNLYYLISQNLELNLGNLTDRFLTLLGFEKTKLITTKKQNHLKDFDFDNAKLLYGKNLKSIIAISKINNIKPIFLTEALDKSKILKDPEIMKIGVNEFTEFHKKFNLEARKIAKENSIDIVDLEKSMIDSSLFSDKFHYSLDGIRFVSSQIASKIYNIEKNTMRETIDRK